MDERIRYPLGGKAYMHASLALGLVDAAQSGTDMLFQADFGVVLAFLRRMTC